MQSIHHEEHEESSVNSGIEVLISQATKLVHPERKVVGLGQLVNELHLSWQDALDLRNEMERRGLVRIPVPEKNEKLG